MKTISNELFFFWVEKEIAEGRSVRFRLKGRSMHPLLRDGLDDVILHPCKREELRPMDVVLFRYKGKHLLHRIIRIDGNRLYIQGDGSIAAKEECLCSDVVGKVMTIVRPSGRMISLSSLEWRFLSHLWQRLRIFRTLIYSSLNRPSRLRR